MPDTLIPGTPRWFAGCVWTRDGSVCADAASTSVYSVCDVNLQESGIVN